MMPRMDFSETRKKMSESSFFWGGGFEFSRLPEPRGRRAVRFGGGERVLLFQKIIDIE